MPRRSASLFSLAIAAFATPFLVYACTIPDYVYDDDRYANAKGLGARGGEAGASQGGQGGSGQGGKAGSGGTAGSGGKAGAGQGGSAGQAGNTTAGQGGAGQGGSAGDAGSAGDSGAGGNAGSSHAGQGGSSGSGGSSGQGGSSGAGGSAGSAGTGGSSGKGGSSGSGGSAGKGGSAGSGGSAGQGGSGGGPVCVVRSFDFASCPQDFTSTGKEQTWECGKPSNGPKADHSGGGSLWATRLNGKPSYCEDSFLESPTVDLSGHTGKPVRLKLWHWNDFRACDPNGAFGFCGATCSPPFPIVPVYSFSGGAVEVFSGGQWKVIKPVEGYGSDQPLYVNGGSGDPKDGGTPPCQESTLEEQKTFAYKGPSKQWVLSTFDLTPYLAADFKLRLHFASAPKDDCYPNSDGWFVDDIEIGYDGACKN